MLRRSTGIGRHLIALSESRGLFRHGIAFLRGIGGKAATPEEISETMIGSKGIPFWIHRREDQMYIVRIVGSLQPLHGGIVLTQPEVHQRRRIWRNVSFARHRF